MKKFLAKMMGSRKVEKRHLICYGDKVTEHIYYANGDYESRTIAWRR